MKTISKRFLKGGLAILLAVIMLFSSTITGFAAVVDNAETKANVDVAETGANLTYYLVPNGDWKSSSATFQIYVSGKDYKFTQIGTSGVYSVSLPDTVSGTCYVKRCSSSGSKWNEFSTTIYTDGRDTFYNTDWNAGTLGRSFKPGSTIYLGVNNNWKSDNARFAAYFATPHDTVTTWVSATNCTDTDCYKVTVPNNNGLTLLIWCRMNPGATANNWNNKWSQTGNLGAQATNNKYTMNSSSWDTGTWSKHISNVTATFKDWDGKELGTSTVASGGTPSYTGITPTREGYTFTGWEPALGAITANTTYTAQYKINTYTVTYNANKGSNPPANQTKTYGTELTLTTSEPTAPAGKKFVSWNTKADGTGDTYLAGGKYVDNANVTLYAQYEDDNVTYTFYDFDGTTELETGTVLSGTDVTNLAPTPTPPLGYIHSGWTPTLGAIDKTTEFRPNKTPIDYTITLNANGGTLTGDNPINYNIETNGVTLPTPTYGNNIFDGWKDEASGEIVTEVEAGSTGDKSYIAQWTMTYKATAYNYVNKCRDDDGTYGGTVTVNGSASPAYTKNGADVTFEATPKTNYKFFGWYSDADFTNRVSSVATYTTQMTDAGITLYALFVKDFYLQNEAGVKAVTFKYDVATDSYTSDDNAFVNKFKITSNDSSDVKDTDVKLSRDTCTGISHIEGHYTTFYTLTADTENYDIKKPVTYSLTPNTTNGTYKLNIVLTEATKFDVTIDGITTQHIPGSTVTVKGNCDTGEYLASATSDPKMNLAIDKKAGTVTFIMPESDVTITTVYEDMYTVTFSDDVYSSTTKEDYYYPGEEVTIEVTPKDGYFINNITSEDVNVTYKNQVITFVMPNKNVTLTAELSQKLAVTVSTIVYNPFKTLNDTEKANFTVATEGIVDGYTAGNITLSANIAKNYTTEYSFIGYYTDSEYKNNIGINKDITYKVTEDNTTIYAVFAKNVYLPNSVSNAWSHVPMAFNPSTKLYSEIINGSSATFKLDSNSGSWTRPATTTFSNGNNVTFVDKGSDDSTVSVNNSTTYKAMTIYFKANTIGSSYTLYGVASTELFDVPDRYTVYLSSGNVSLNGTYNTAAFDSHSVITTEDNNISSGNEASISHTGEGRVNEHYIKYTVVGDMEIEFQTTISGTSADTYYIYKYLIYGIESKSYLGVVTPEEDTPNVFTSSHYVTEDCYIVPVFFRTEEYYSTTDGVSEIEFFFDAKDIKSTTWGPFVSVYMYGTDGTNIARLNGGWPGQLMVPTPDGRSYYVSIEVPDGVTTQGITFCNYMEFSVPASFFAVSGKQQTYDYREGITLTEQGIDSIYFRAKTGDIDNYHGDDNLKPDNNQISLGSYKFEYLKEFNDIYLMNLNGQHMKDVEYSDASVVADYYIVAKGNVDYNVKATNNKYQYEQSYSGEWSVDWYVYDNNGKYITHCMSDSFFHNDEYSATGTDTTSELLERIMAAQNKTADYYNDKKVAISYERENGSRYDGQWYGGNNLESDAYAYVGLADVSGKFTFADMSDTNEEEYGFAGVLDANDNPVQHAVIPSDPGTVTLYAEPRSGHVFVGWYTFGEDGKASKISSSLVEEDIDINFTESYYAVFRPVGTNELVVNHNIYNNSDISSGVPSHGGRAKLQVSITDSSGKTTNGAFSNNGSTVSIPVTEGKTYTITIKTDPTGRDKFYAWYMATTDVNNKVTYEEVLMDDPAIYEKIGTSDPISVSFTYTYNPAYKNNIINLYSDMIKISTNATYRYEYKDRFGEPKYYTVTAELNQNELDGYGGNGGFPYWPTYITEYTLFDANGKQVGEPVYGDDAFKAIDKSTYSTYTTYNAVQKYAPSASVTQAYDMDIQWIITRQYMTELGDCVVHLKADVKDSTYTVEYRMPDGKINYVRDVEYNYLLDDVVIAPETYNGQKFSYWQEYTYGANEEVIDGEILCYTTKYNYRVTEDKCIKAVYGKDVVAWSPTIDSVTYTREMSDSGDYVYTDYLLAYTSSDGKILDELKATDSSIKYGLIAVRNSQYVYTKEQYDKGAAITYPIERENKDYFEKYIKAVAGYGVNKAFKSEDQTIQYNAYCYDLTSKETTDFNRINYYLRYNLNNENQKGYAFTCYAYLIIDGVTYISSPVNTCIANAAYAPVN